MRAEILRFGEIASKAALANEQLLKQMQTLEKRVGKHDADIEAILAAMKALIAPRSRTARGIGFLADIK